MATNAPEQMEVTLTETPAEIDLSSAGDWEIQNTSSAKNVARIAQVDRLHISGNYQGRTSAGSVGQLDSITSTTDTTKDFWIREEDVPIARQVIVVGRRMRLFSSTANGAMFTITDVDEDDQSGGVEFECDIGSITISGTGFANFANATEFSGFLIGTDDVGFDVLPGGHLEIDHASSGVVMAWAINGPGTLQMGKM